MRRKVVGESGEEQQRNGHDHDCIEGVNMGGRLAWFKGKQAILAITSNIVN